MTYNSEPGCTNLWGTVCNNYCEKGECFLPDVNTQNNLQCQCPPGFVGSKCDQEAKWVEFKSASSFMRFSTPNTFLNRRDLQTLFVLPTNSRNDPAKIVDLLTNADVVTILVDELALTIYFSQPCKLTPRTVNLVLPPISII